MDDAHVTRAQQAWHAAWLERRAGTRHGERASARLFGPGYRQ